MLNESATESSRTSSNYNHSAFNVLYAKSPQGILKLLQLVFGIIVVSCASGICCRERLHIITTTQLSTAITTEVTHTTATAEHTTVTATSLHSTTEAYNDSTSTASNETLEDNQSTKVEHVETTTLSNATEPTHPSLNDSSKAPLASEVSEESAAHDEFGEEKCYAYGRVGAQGQGFVQFVGSVCIIATGLLLIVHFFNLHTMDTFLGKVVNWSLIEFCFTATAILFYFIAFIVEAWYGTGWHNPEFSCSTAVWKACATFASFTWLCYIAGMYFHIVNR